VRYGIRHVWDEARFCALDQDLLGKFWSELITIPGPVHLKILGYGMEFVIEGK